MPEDLQSISSSRVAAAEVARHSFGTVRRGFDPQEVRAYLELVARELAVWEQHDQELRREVAQAEERSRNPVLDESTLTAALGQQSAQVLRSAHEEAARIALQAEEAAAVLVREAQSQAAEVQVQAESGTAERIAEAEIAVSSIHQQAQQEAALLLEGSRAEGEALVVRAREQGQAMIEQAQETRRRVLADMAQRRRAMTLQIEQFRAARDELAASVLGVRDSVDRIVGDLARADDQARAAAAEVARRQPTEPSGTGPSGTQSPEEVLVAEVEVERVEAVFDVEAGKPAVAEVVVEEVEGDGDGDTDAVEGLFARLRAGHPGGAGGSVPADEGAPAQDVSPDGEDAGSPEGAEGPEGAGEATDDDVAVEDPVRSQRAELLDPIVTRLARQLKRALQDDQNRLLDRLRSGSGLWSDDVLPPEDEQRAVYVDAASASLREAVAAGTAFARGQGGARGKARAPDDKVVAEAAEGLAGTVVALLRRRLGGGESTTGADGGSERVGAAYREWRGERIERLVGDYALGAFSVGVLAATGKGTGVRWVLGGDGPACADCDDNALAGTVVSGEEFPTGHPHPPAHAGCRCLVVPTPA